MKRSVNRGEELGKNWGRIWEEQGRVQRRVEQRGKFLVEIVCYNLIDTPSLISLLAYNMLATHTYLVTHSGPITIRLGFFIRGPRERPVSANGSLPWRLDIDKAVLTLSPPFGACLSPSRGFWELVLQCFQVFPCSQSFWRR
jgi:hypothetical protein